MITTDADPGTARVAYFSMEVGLESEMPTYSGGLGVLAGDTLRAAAASGIPIVGVTLLYRNGYIRQRLSPAGVQSEEPSPWRLDQFLEPLPPRVTVAIEGRPISMGVWRYLIRGISGHTVPVYFLDTDHESNDASARKLTDSLYSGDQRHRLAQEAVLGLGGVAMVRALGHSQIRCFHLNEGHSALLALGLIAEQSSGEFPPVITDELRQTVRRQCVFTTHTPVPAGHDQFPMSIVQQILGDRVAATLTAAGCCPGDTLNMTSLALSFSHYINGVAMSHGALSRGMYPEYPVNCITNGVHASSWTSPPFQRLFDAHVPEWRHDNLYLRYAVSIPPGEIEEAHAESKRAMIATVAERCGVRLDPAALTLGFARRATEYKRTDLLFTDLNRLRRIARNAGPLQIVFGGKAHPDDQGGKDLIRRVFEAAAALKNEIRVVYLENYDLALARLLTSGSDVWLNTPLRPHEASGTSGMKAALNGVPSLSVLDGWWIEGHIEGVTGWALGEHSTGPDGPEGEATSLYDKLEYVILPLFFGRPLTFAEIRRMTIAVNGSFFSTQRMVGQYLQNAYGAGGDSR
jgi:glycogen phosphorylase